MINILSDIVLVKQDSDLPNAEKMKPNIAADNKLYKDEWKQKNLDKSKKASTSDYV